MSAPDSFESLLHPQPQEHAERKDAQSADEVFMAAALGLAARIPRRPWPNPPVGAVVVSEGRIVGRGAHHGPGTRHAEIAALAEAGPLARGATLYCTLEPCNHQGRTPPCAPAVAASGLARAVLALRDPNPTVRGGGIDLLQRARIEVELGVGADAALDLIWPFATTQAFARPYVMLKTATSLDGRFGPPLSAADRGPGRPFYLTGPEALADAHRMRRWLDLVLVGERTVEADRPRLDGRLAGPDAPCPQQEPQAAYADTDLSWRGSWKPEGHLVFCGQQSAQPAARKLREAAGATVVPCRERDGRVELRGALAEAFRLGIQTLMVEGGPQLAASLLKERLVDRWVQYVAPVVLGAGATWPNEAGPAARAAQQALAAAHPAADAAADFTLTSAERVGRDLRLVWDREPFAARRRELTKLD